MKTLNIIFLLLTLFFLMSLYLFESEENQIGKSQKINNKLQSFQETEENDLSCIFEKEKNDKIKVPNLGREKIELLKKDEIRNLQPEEDIISSVITTFKEKRDYKKGVSFVDALCLWTGRVYTLFILEEHIPLLDSQKESIKEIRRELNREYLILKEEYESKKIEYSLLLNKLSKLEDRFFKKIVLNELDYIQRTQYLLLVNSTFRNSKRVEKNLTTLEDSFLEIDKELNEFYSKREKGE